MGACMDEHMLSDQRAGPSPETVPDDEVHAACLYA